MEVVGTPKSINIVAEEDNNNNNVDPQDYNETSRKKGNYVSSQNM